ncbi:LPS-assembly protein LptD [Ramlibacter sp. PS4R-6]|uniref:LPS-assembly protein LptD n=1 Tax=Ramlibacter sp. PS4R-6 TaxID=3133438 RepID=UPI0030AC2FAF
MPQPRTKARRAPFSLTPVALVACALLHAPLAHAQAPAEPPLQLKSTPMLREDVPQASRQQLPSFVSGDTIHGTPDLDTVVEGHAELRRGDTVIRADRLEYYAPDDLAKARGNVRINRAGNVFEGPELQLKVESFEGFFNQPRYRLLRNDAYGQADRVDFIDDKRSVIRNATYTTCQREDYPGWMPAWILRADSIRIDEEEEVGQAQGASLSFLGMAVPVPSMSFPLTDKRKSGLLPPTIGVDNVSGVEVTMPYYWNIAPNRDATIYPTLMSKRGLDLGAEFRYLEPTYRGTVRGDYMPGDSLRHRDRWAYAARHDGVFSTAAGGLGLHLDLNRVSDDNYWRDFSRASASLTQRLLANEGTLSWAQGNFSVSARALKWQTLQDVSAPITPPYDRMPQVVARYAREQLPGGFDTLLETDTTRFRSDETFTLQPNAVRTYALARIARPWQAPGWFVIPRLQLHATRYEFDTPLVATGSSVATRTVPTFSLDSGLVFERDANIFGRALRQTLEPRAFYVKTPYRNQNFLPNYDTARYDFSFATVYSENEFGGHDRLADEDLLTVGVGTRLLDAETGAQAARFDIAQRIRFRDQLVTLPGQAPATERLSDILLGASVSWVPQWGTDLTLQYNPKTGRSERATFAARYNPKPYHVVSAAYRVQREQPDQSEQLDIGWQWPISDLFGKRASERSGGRWYSVGRLNMSLKDRRVVDGIVGFEYDACCWVGRIVLERLQSGNTSSNKRILFQIEFVGFTRIGSSALQTLRDNIPRYQFLHERTAPPSRFTNYE